MSLDVDLTRARSVSHVVESDKDTGALSLVVGRRMDMRTTEQLSAVLDIQ